jgi:hypothetical protein
LQNYLQLHQKSSYFKVLKLKIIVKYVKNRIYLKMALNLVLLN